MTDIMRYLAEEGGTSSLRDVANAVAATEAWTKVLGWFGKHVG